MADKETGTNPRIKFHDVSIIFLQYFDLGEEINFDKLENILNRINRKDTSVNQRQEPYSNAYKSWRACRDKPEAPYSFTEHFKDKHMPIIVTIEDINLSNFPEISKEISIKEFLEVLKVKYPSTGFKEKVQAKKEDYSKKFYFASLEESETMKVEGSVNIRFSRSGVACIRTRINPTISGQKASLNVREIVFLTNYLIDTYMLGKREKEYSRIIKEMSRRIFESCRIREDDDFPKYINTYMVILTNGSKPKLLVNKLKNSDEEGEDEQIKKEIVALSVRSPIWPPPYHRKYLKKAIESNLSFRDDEFIFIEDQNTLICKPTFQTPKEDTEFDFTTLYENYVQDMIRLIEIERMERVALHRYEDYIDSTIQEIMKILKVSNTENSSAFRIPEDPKEVEKLQEKILAVKERFREAKDAVDLLEIDRNFGIKHFRMIAERIIEEFGLSKCLFSIERKIAYVERIREAIQNFISDSINTDIQRRVLFLQIIFLLGIAAQIAGLLWLELSIAKVVIVWVFLFITFTLLYRQVPKSSDGLRRLKKVLVSRVTGFLDTTLHKIVRTCKERI